MGTSDSSSKPERASLRDPGGRRGPGEKGWPLRKDPRGPLAFGLTLGTSAGPELLRGGGHCFKRSGRDGRPLSCCSLFCGQRVVGLECIPVEGAQPSGLSSVPSPLPLPTHRSARAWLGPGHWEEPGPLSVAPAAEGRSETRLPEECGCGSETQFGCETFIRNPVLGEEEGAELGRGRRQVAKLPFPSSQQGP